MAKYLAGLAVPAAVADGDASLPSQTAPESRGEETKASPTPIPNTAPQSPNRPPPQSSWMRRPGSFIPNRVFPSSPTNPSPIVTQTPVPHSSTENPWFTHSNELDRAWKHTQETQLTAIANWAPSALGSPYHQNGTMFYMFSGPDFLYAHAFFPEARTYILVGNEPVGPVPSLNQIPAQALPLALANIRKSLESVLNWSFFITKNMKTDLTQSQLSGTLPLLYVFLARAGCTIESVTPVTINHDGVLAEGEGKKDEGRITPGVRIIFQAQSEIADSSTPQHLNSSTQMVYYFCTDLSDDGIKSTPGLLRFCEEQGRGVSLLKAASYLMHEPGFSRVRQFLLDQSDIIVQDDSGIPFRFFAEQSPQPNDRRGADSPRRSEAWNIQLWGPYRGPIDVFKQYWQQDLADEFARTPGGPLPFGFGYQWQPSRSNLMIVSRKRNAI